DDVLPFLENVLRGRNVPRERMLEVAAHYEHFDGKSPLNDQMRDLVRKLRVELAAHSIDLPVYWGNRNWHPLLADTVRQMAADGVRRAVAIATSAYSSYSGCRQYIENIAAARATVGPSAPEIDKLPPFWNHPGFVAANADRAAAALQQIPEDRRAECRLIFTAHSIPQAMAAQCRYEEQLVETARRVSERAAHAEWDLVWQSRSGPPSQPWLEPDILDHLRALAADGVKDAVVAPIGFLSDHMEVIYDLDYEAAHLAHELGINLVRAETAGTHPSVIGMLDELISAPFTVCAEGCCPAPRRA
ncbi:MAG: ferrochelatase, partial [Acidobacteriota bacterium]|nr:ferrochelatase [Acidobacteriota bacterium]